MTNPVVPVGTFTVAEAVMLPVIANADPLEAFLSETILLTPVREGVIFSPSTAVAVDDEAVAALGVTALGAAGVCVFAVGIDTAPWSTRRPGVEYVAADEGCTSGATVTASDSDASATVAARGGLAAAGLLTVTAETAGD